MSRRARAAARRPGSAAGARPGAATVHPDPVPPPVADPAAPVPPVPVPVAPGTPVPVVPVPPVLGPVGEVPVPVPLTSDPVAWELPVPDPARAGPARRAGPGSVIPLARAAGNQREGEKRENQHGSKAITNSHGHASPMFIPVRGREGGIVATRRSTTTRGRFEESDLPGGLADENPCLPQPLCRRPSAPRADPVKGGPLPGQDRSGGPRGAVVVRTDLQVGDRDDSMSTLGGPRRNRGSRTGSSRHGRPGTGARRPHREEATS